MTDNRASRISCGANNPSFQLYTGRRIQSGNPPANGNYSYVLRCSDNRLFRREGNSWVPENISPNQRFVFYDVSSESIDLINFESMPGLVGASPFVPSLNGGGVVSPIVTSVTRSPHQLTQASAPVQLRTPVFTTGAVSNGTFTSTPNGTVTSTNNLALTSVPESTPLATPGPVTAPANQTIVSEGFANGANLLLAVISDNSALISAPGEQGEINGSFAQGRLSGNSRAIISDNAAYAQFVAVNGSIVHSDQDASHAGGVAADCSLLHSAAPSSMARGTTSDRSQIRTGGMPVVKNLPTSSRFTVAQVGFGVITDNTVQAITFDTSNGCADRTVFVNDDSLALRPPLGVFGRLQVLGSIGLDNAPGVGHGALASGLSVDQSHLLATANGSLSVGQARCGEVHMAAGLASAVLGRANRALGAYSQGFGHNALAYMHAQFAQAIPTTINDDVQKDANRIQHSQVPLRGFTTAERIISQENPEFFTGFELTTLLVLGDTPDNARLDVRDGPTMDWCRTPFLPVNGTAIIEADVVSSLLQTENPRYRLAPFCGKFCFCITRTGSGNQYTYDILPTTEDGEPSIGAICVFPEPAALGLTITAEQTNAQLDGVTIKIIERVPFSVEIGNRFRPNPRINPVPERTFPLENNQVGVPIANRTNFYVQGRIWGGHFRYTEVPEGSSEVRVEAPTPDRIYTITQPAFSTISAAGLQRVAAAASTYRECKSATDADSPVEVGWRDKFTPSRVSFGNDAVAGLDALLNPGFGTTANFGTDTTFSGTGLDNPNPGFAETNQTQVLNRLAQGTITTPNF